MQNIHQKKIIKDAWDLFELKEYDQAHFKLKTLNQESGRSNYLSGLIGYFQNNFKESEQALTKALQYEDTITFKGYVHYWLGNVYAYDDFFTNFNNPVQDKKKAEKEYELAIKEENCPVDAYYELIKMKDDTIEKENIILKGIEAFPLDINLYYSLSMLHGVQGNVTKQKHILLKAIENDIKSSAINFELGRLLFSEKKYVDALKHFTNALNYHKESDRAAQLISYYIGVSEFYLGNIEKSAEVFLESVDYNPLDTGSWFPRVGYLFTLNKLRKKKKIVEYIESIDFDIKLFRDISFKYNLMTYLDASSMIDGEFLFPAKNIISLIQSSITGRTSNHYKLKANLLLAALYSFNDDRLNCLKSYRKLHAYSYQYEFINSAINTLYSDNLEISSNFEELVNMFQEDIKQDSLKSDTRNDVLVGVIEKLFKLKDYTRILDIGKYIHQQDSIPAEIYFEYAYSSSESGQPDIAKGYYERIIKSDNKSTAALNNLGVIYKNDGDLQKAIALFKSAIKIEPGNSLYSNNLKNSEQQLLEREKIQKNNQIPKQWLNTKEKIDINILTDLDYFSILNKITRTNKKYRVLLSRDFKELTFNYLVGNHKSTVVLSGSLVELALTYYCEKKRILQLELTEDSGKIKKVKLYNAVLNDLVNFSHQQNWFGNDFHSLGNLSRIYRNFIHPGLELKSNAEIEPKAKLCYLSTVEILKKVLN